MRSPVAYFQSVSVNAYFNDEIYIIWHLFFSESKIKKERKKFQECQEKFRFLFDQEEWIEM